MQIQIWVISGTLVSRTAMLDALEHKINVSSQLSAHGGFDFAHTELGVTTVGTSREPINAWLPLYVTKSHWDRVKVCSVNDNVIVPWIPLSSPYRHLHRKIFIF